MYRESLRFGLRRSVQLQLQNESAECGIACLAMIASFHGRYTDLRELRSRFAASLRGVSLTKLGNMASTIGMASRAVRLEPNELKNLQLPCVLHWDLQHFVVLSRVSNKGLRISDPAAGDVLVSWIETAHRFSGIALELTPALDFKKKKRDEDFRFTKLFGKIIGLNRSLFQIFILAFVIEIFTVATPFFNQWVIDDAIVSNDSDLLAMLVAGFGLLWLFQTATEAVRGWAVNFMSVSLNIQWAANVFSHLLNLPLSYFDKRHMGGVVSRFNTINAIQGTLTTSFVEAILDGMMSIGTLSMMLIYSPLLAMISVASLAIYIALRIGLYNSLRMSNESQFVWDAKQHSYFMESVRGIQTIKLFDQTSARVSAWLNMLVRSKNALLANQRLMLFFHTGNAFLSRSEMLLVMYYGATKVMQKEFSVGMLVAFLSYRSQFSQRVSSLVDKFYELKMLRVQSERLADIVLTEKESVDIPFNTTPVINDYSIELRDVSFNYGTEEKYIVRNCSFKILSGESVAIVGPSGSGKTTLLKLMSGLLRPSTGTISIGGIPVTHFGSAEHRMLFATVLQDDHLFAGTIAENICFFDERPDHARIDECARRAAIMVEVQAMPMGFNTLVGDMGAALSGGQKQRVLLARALYKQPKILFLDEATSHLDTENEKFVSDAIASLRLTRVIVAHRAETIRTADRVIDLLSTYRDTVTGSELKT